VLSHYQKYINNFVLGVVLCLMFASSALAQSFSTTSTGQAIGAGTSCAAGNDLNLPIIVTDSFTIADVVLGFQAEHTWRGDLDVRLQSPAGTVVQVITPDVTITGNIDNYNVLLDDAAITPINTAPHNTPDGTVAPPYENLVQPSTPLSAFNGQNALGTWNLLICDGFPAEDDGTFGISTLTLIEDILPPTGPTLSCPITEQIPFAWGAEGTPNGWDSATLTNSYTIGTSIPMDITITGDTGFFVPRNGVNTPVTSTEFTGGGAPQNTVILFADFPTQTNSMTITVNLGTPGQGVGSASFNIFDIDQGGWIDRVTATASLAGAPVTPISLSGSSANTVSGNQLIGTAGAASTSANGTGFLTFSNQIDQVTLIYDNDPSVGPNPAPQVMGFFANLRVCPILAADLTAVKSVEVFDPANAGLYMTPGNEVLYTITVNNSAAATAEATDIDLSDILPANVSFVSATTTGFTGGAFGTPDLPAANTDCIGGACVIRFSGGTLPIDATGEVLVRALIK